MMHDSNGKWIGQGPGDFGPTPQKVNHRLLYAYPKNSQAVALGVQDTQFYTDATAAAVKNLQPHLDPPQPATGIANAATLYAMKAVVPPVWRSRYPIQGVGGQSNAFLNPPDSPSFNKDTDGFAAEGNRLTSLTQDDLIVIGYSMGGVSVCKYLNTLRPDQRDRIKMVITFGDPSMPASGSLMGDMPGEGISKLPQPQWCWDRYYSFALDGDWYPQATGLLFFLYDILTRAELTLDFALWLFTSFPMLAFQQLIGAAPSNDPLSGVLSGLGGMLTTGPTSTMGSVLGPLQLFAILPELVTLLFDAIKFLATNAHGMYGDPGHAVFNGLTGVDCAVELAQQVVPHGATTLLFPGTWAQWNQGFQFDVAARLNPIAA